MPGLKWLAWANATTFACGRISFASRLAVPMTRGLSRGLPLFEARSPLCHCFGRCFDGGVVATFAVVDMIGVAGRSKVFLEMVAKLAGIYRRRITAASSQEIARYISEDTMARMVIPVITMFILKICAPYWMR